MQITCISDTHNFHDRLSLPASGDLIIHAGDLTEAGTKRELEDFFEWFSQLPFTYKICIAGNHDFYLEHISSSELEELLPENVIYLNDSGVNLEGIHFWGSPYIPYQEPWAFSKPAEEIQQHWKKIPDNTDILITHTPPKGILDETNKQIEVGCPYLRKTIETQQPKLHIFGHLHENYGKVRLNNTLFINATSFINNLRISNTPIQVNFPD